MKKPKIAVLHNRAVVPDPTLYFPAALKQLRRLGESGVLDFAIVALDDPQVRLELHTYDALLMRPKWGGAIRDEHLQGLLQLERDKPLVIGTFSKGRSKIALSKELLKRVEVVSGEYGNLDSTAELTIWMAITLRRRLHAYCAEMPFGYWATGRETLGGLKGVTWSIIGAGSLASRVLARLPGLGVQKVKVWDYKGGSERFRKFLLKADLDIEAPIEYVMERKKQPGYHVTKVRGNPGFNHQGKIIEEGKNIEIVFDNSLKRVIASAEIISSVLGIEEDKDGTKSTKHLVTVDLLKVTEDHTILVNVGRAEVFHPNVYRELYPNFRCGGGFGADVLEEDLEDGKVYAAGPGESHLVWAAFSSSMLNSSLIAASRATPLFGAELRTGPDHIQANPEPQNVFLSPHVGGATPESEEMIGVEVVSQIVEFLNIRASYDALTPNP